MNFSPANVLAFSFAILLHGLVAAAFLVEWQAEPTVTVDSDRTYFIPAKMYAENPHTAKASREAEQKRLKSKRDKAQRDKQAALDKKRAADLLAKQKADKVAADKAADKVAQLQAQQLAEQQREAQEQAEELEALRIAEAESELQKLINAEIDAIEAVTDDEKAMAYVGQIQRDIIQNWSRPPSARNGMQTLLKVFLVPTGEVVDVSVLTSSGNDAFDRSAIQAVRKVRRFEVPTDARLFENKFREFEVLFRPEDLRL